MRGRLQPPHSYHQTPTLSPQKGYQRLNFTSLLSEPLNQRTRCKSIHALTPSMLKPMTPKTMHYPFSTAPQSARINSDEQRKDFNVIKTLFLDWQSVLRKLELETQALEKQKQQVVASNKEEYQKIMQKLMEMRKICNKRRQDIEALRNQLRSLESNHSYRKIKDFSTRRESQRVQRAALPHQQQSGPKSKNAYLFANSGKPAYNIMSAHLNF